MGSGSMSLSSSNPAERVPPPGSAAAIPLFRRLGVQGRISVGLSVVTAIFGVVYLDAASQLYVPQLVDPVGPKAFPYLLGVALLACAVGLLVEGLTLFRDEAPATTRLSELKDPRYRIVAGVMAWTLLYFLAFNPLGYILATTLFLVGLIYVFDGRRPMRSLVVAIGFAVVTYIAFNDYLEVTLPAGKLIGYL